ncbi:DEHA2B16720p [Debaryomyces hansenii CBS767]|uniref:DEHA2B16720p n=1 Tax=Debaryomyces hansenii (strain ATCC 36239 / CBS 767 / BCRC 21394 / JCM 1990 / NBRC 0083 / IGC 2968) TaxID=284592 RepID=Q6BVT9_DEBHA|nr:DEHA2B16720p [Debaryomyces hansenii CBS767]CAG85694.2 DEHA2B16720p [Debaryomyces hansenii CBS767]|eukprot:XP_457680.2 DEHA2B16720p [Debaryomyces hansenii CBS767]
MPCMYFSGVDSNAITIDDPSNECIVVNPEVYDGVHNNKEQNARAFLDTHLLRIRSGRSDQNTSPGRLVPRSKASVDIGNTPFMRVLVYTSRALITAEFREMSSNEFKDMYLAPLDNALRVSSIRSRLLAEDYRYPSGDAMHVEHAIQEYFNEIAIPIKGLYRDVGDTNNYFGSPSIIRPTLDQRRIVQPDIIHMIYKSDIQYPEIIFGIGDYKTGVYKMTEGFEELKAAIESQIENLSNRRRLRSQSSGSFFPNREWSPRVLFALVLRKYIYQAFLCGTDRFFISDHQTFSGFFKYEIMNDKMSIDYYIINDPETVEHGITLRSAIAGFFYKNEADAIDTKGRLMKTFEVARKTEEQDPFLNVLPKLSYGSSGKLSDSGVSSKLASKLDPVKENDDSDNFDAIDGNTYCRVIYDSAEFYPDLKLPSPVFVKLYYYSSRLWKGNSLMCLELPEKEGYYGMFFNELAINEKIASSQFASNFPKLLVSGYWNGLPDHPMHIFEYLGKEMQEDNWDKKKVHRVIKSRLKELHSLGISHNDVRPANIHVSVSGKISLIDFGLSDCSNNEKRKKNDFENLDYILGVHGSNESYKHANRVNAKSEAIPADRADKNDKYGNDSNSSSEEVFDEGSSGTFGTQITIEDIASKPSRR